MRMKAFLIFIVIFTAFYIAFWTIYDKVTAVISKNKIKSRAYSLIDYDSYLLFAQFYGINGTVNLATLRNIFSNYYDQEKIIFSTVAPQYGVTSNEFAVIYLYFEYLNLFKKKIINLESGVISSMSFDDLALINKYQPFFQMRSDFQSIYDKFGNTARQQLSYLDHGFLIPGVRFINDVIFYFEGANQ